MSDCLAGLATVTGMLASKQVLSVAEARLAAVTAIMPLAPPTAWASLSQQTGVESTPVTIAASHPVAAGVDAAQYRAGTGPVLRAFSAGEPVIVDDLAADPQWSAVVAGLADPTDEALVRAVLSCPLAPFGQPGIALNLYAAEPGAYRGRPAQAGRYAAASLALALAGIDQRALAGQLEQALRSNRRIGTAMGILMSGSRCTEDQAITTLRRCSQNSNRRLTDIADYVVLTGALPGDCEDTSADGVESAPAAN